MILKNIFQRFHIFLIKPAYNAAETLLTSFTPFILFFAMGNLLYIIAVVLVIIWAVSFFGGFFTGGIIHILLVIAIIAILLRVISGRSAV